ncbi:MAG: methyltransferase domain-containing protein, partial [Deltaproteobacteria bacterium]|nr:methyltransferase domain-containing protein [Deltaproteobacteria bacterium]
MTPTTQTYYDRFSATYEDHRHHGYHRMIDELELELIRRYGAGRDVFEAGCGTGLLLKEAAAVARSAVGLDLSRGMLGQARDRGLKVVQGSITHVPLPSASFDLAYSMKVLAHIPPIENALVELARLIRPGGHLLLEFYNPWSLRYLAKRWGGPARIADETTDHDVFTRYDTLERARSYLPEGLKFVGVRGVRVVTPTSKLWGLPGLGSVFERVEHAICDLPGLRRLGGFMIVIAQKTYPMAQLRGDILLVDDERSVREFLAIYLKRAGHQVETVASMAEAREAIARHEFDVLITDLRMPD